jgi:hypothetical protein
MLDDQSIEKFLSLILESHKAELKEDEINVIQDILQNQELRDYLILDERTESLVKRLYKKIDLNDLDELILLCTGAWLEATTGIVINENGDLLVDIDNNYTVNIDNKLDTSKFFVMQAILRHIERWVTMKHLGLLDSKSKVDKILEVGAGTLICSSMMRDVYPQSLIIAEEPGLLSPKSLHIAQKNNIQIIRALSEIDKNQKFDRILLHFVLEHCNSKEVSRLIKMSLKHLSEDGLISIVVPNYDAYHRELEIQMALNGRSQRTRLSKEDKLCGHKLIFNKANIERIIKTEMDSLRINLNIDYQTVLPRPLSFKNLTKINEYKVLAQLQKLGHISGMENKGSVISVLIGKSTNQLKTPTDITGQTKTLFLSLLNKYAAIQSNQEIKQFVEKLDL